MKKNNIIFISLFVLSFNTIAETPKNIIEFNSEEGIKRLYDSKNRVDFAILAEHFQTESNKYFSGNTSAAIVMNALRFNTDKKNVPLNEKYLKSDEISYAKEKNILYHYYNEKNVMDKARVNPRQILGIEKADNQPVKDIVLQELYLAMRRLSDRKSFNFKMLFYVATNHSSKKNQQRTIVKNLNQTKDFVIVNYNPKLIFDTDNDNSYAPLGAYHKESDSFLVMDVSPNKGWFWLPSDLLFKAMRNKHHGRNRGIIFIGGKDKK